MSSTRGDGDETLVRTGERRTMLNEERGERAIQGQLE